MDLINLSIQFIGWKIYYTDCCDIDYASSLKHVSPMIMMGHFGTLAGVLILCGQAHGATDSLTKLGPMRIVWIRRYRLGHDGALNVCSQTDLPFKTCRLISIMILITIVGDFFLVCLYPHGK